MIIAGMVLKVLYHSTVGLPSLSAYMNFQKPYLTAVVIV